MSSRASDTPGFGNARAPRASACAGIALAHPWPFWVGCIAVAAGVGLHLPMYVMAAPMGFHLAGMPMDLAMEVGMALIPLGVLLAAYGLMPRLAQVRPTLPGIDQAYFHAVERAPLNREHWLLVAVLSIALAIDVMKPASIAFVMPGMAREYGLGMPTVGYLALSALLGTAIGSVLWGRLADVFGRRATILLSAIMFMGTAICGTMPAFGWNLVMCFMMGAAAGGMLPIAFTLMAEIVPARHRGWLLVMVGGIGTSAGFLLASGAAALLEPDFSWRALWLLNLPTGALVVLLNRHIPESPRFLASVGLHAQARAVLARFAGPVPTSVPDETVEPVPAPEDRNGRPGASGRLHSRAARTTLALAVCGIAWGLTNFGFVLWLPAGLQRLALDTRAANLLMAESALLAIPGIAVVVWLYQRWSSVRTLVLFIAMTIGALAMFACVEITGARAPAIVVTATALLLVAISGVIATMIPYAAEIYPLRRRGTGSGLIAASAKFGGILGAGAGVAGLFDTFAGSALVIVVPMLVAGVLLWRDGVETRGLGLEAIQQRLHSG